MVPLHFSYRCIRLRIPVQAVLITFLLLRFSISCEASQAKGQQLSPLGQQSSHYDSNSPLVHSTGFKPRSTHIRRVLLQQPSAAPDTGTNQSPESQSGASSSNGESSSGTSTTSPPQEVVPDDPRPGEAVPEVLLQQEQTAQVVRIKMTMKGITSADFSSNIEKSIIRITAAVTGTKEEGWKLVLPQQQQQQPQQQMLRGRRLLVQQLLGAHGSLPQHRQLQQQQQQQQQQSGLQVSLSASATKPQLVWYRLAKAPPVARATAVTSSSSGCSTEYCAQLIALSIPVDSSSIQVTPAFDSLLPAASPAAADAEDLGATEVQKAIEENERNLNKHRNAIWQGTLVVVSFLVVVVAVWQRKRIVGLYHKISWKASSPENDVEKAAKAASATPGSRRSRRNSSHRHSAPVSPRSSSDSDDERPVRKPSSKSSIKVSSIHSSKPDPPRTPRGGSDQVEDHAADRDHPRRSKKASSEGSSKVSSKHSSRKDVADHLHRNRSTDHHHGRGRSSDRSVGTGGSQDRNQQQDHHDHSDQNQERCHDQKYQRPKGICRRGSSRSASSGTGRASRSGKARESSSPRSSHRSARSEDGFSTPKHGRAPVADAPYGAFPEIKEYEDYLQEISDDEHDDLKFVNAGKQNGRVADHSGFNNPEHLDVADHRDLAVFDLRDPAAADHNHAPGEWSIYKHWMHLSPSERREVQAAAAAAAAAAASLSAIDHDHNQIAEPASRVVTETHSSSRASSSVGSRQSFATPKASKTSSSKPGSIPKGQEPCMPESCSAMPSLSARLSAENLVKLARQHEKQGSIDAETL